MSRTTLGSFGFGLVLAVAAGLVLAFVSSYVAFRGWPGMNGDRADRERVVLAPPVSRPAVKPVVLGGAADTARRTVERRRARRVAPAARVRSRPPAAASRATVVGPTVASGAPATSAPVRRAPARGPVVAAAPDASPAGRAGPVEQVAETVQRAVAPAAPAAPVEPAERPGLAGAADDVVGALDKISP